MSYIRSQANFLMIDIGKEQTADEISDRLLRQGVIVRSLTAYGYPQHIRVTVGKHEENTRFLEALKQVI
jgi:histidinol-phosphate aminotransferase